MKKILVVLLPLLVVTFALTGCVKSYNVSVEHIEIADSARNKEVSKFDVNIVDEDDKVIDPSDTSGVFKEGSFAIVESESILTLEVKFSNPDKLDIIGICFNTHVSEDIQFNDPSEEVSYRVAWVYEGDFIDIKDEEDFTFIYVNIWYVPSEYSSSSLEVIEIYSLRVDSGIPGFEREYDVPLNQITIYDENGVFKYTTAGTISVFYIICLVPMNEMIETISEIDSVPEFSDYIKIYIGSKGFGISLKFSSDNEYLNELFTDIVSFVYDEDNVYTFKKALSDGLLESISYTFEVDINEVKTYVYITENC